MRIERVFVYGTLRKGDFNHPLITRVGGIFVGTEWIDGYQMYHLGGFPGVVRGKGKVFGEVYVLPMPKYALKRLDRLEGAPVMFRRSVVLTRFGEAYIYLWNSPVYALPKIDSGNWDDAEVVYRTAMEGRNERRIDW